MNKRKKFKGLQKAVDQTVESMRPRFLSTIMFMLTDRLAITNPDEVQAKVEGRRMFVVVKDQAFEVTQNFNNFVESVHVNLRLGFKDMESIRYALRHADCAVDQIIEVMDDRRFDLS